MTAATLIRKLADTGIRVFVRGDKLHVEAKPGKITAEVRALLANRKADLIVELSGMRGRLLALADAEGLDAGIVRALPESELTATAAQCAAVEADQPGCGRELARTYLHMLATSAMMRAGRLPPDFDTPAMCRLCGSVWLPRSQVAMLDVLDGWPTAWGCPWCFVQPPEGHRIPRPRVTCGSCGYFLRDTVNPVESMGRCGINATIGTTWPHEERSCKTFKPKEPNR